MQAGYPGTALEEMNTGCLRTVRYSTWEEADISVPCRISPSRRPQHSSVCTWIMADSCLQTIGHTLLTLKESHDEWFSQELW